MILKIERYNDRQAWWMYDDIKKISVSHRLHKGGLINNNPHDAWMLDLPDCGCPLDGGCSDCKEYMVLICRMNDGSEYSIAFDTICYVMNDNGRTIERIVANYND